LELASRGVVGLRDKAARLNALALAQYRAGQLEEAIASLTESNGMPWGSGGSEPQKAVNWLVLAMADQRLGRAEEAQMCLHTARGLFDRARPNLPGEPAELNASEDWVMMNVLLGEAESLGIGRLDWFASGTEPERYAVKFYRWTSRGPHSPPADWQEVISQPPVDEDAMDVIDYEWRKLGAPTPKCPSDYFGIVATASRELPSGNYLIHASADDGVRIWIDDVLVIDEWHWQDGAKDYNRSIHLEEGDHTIHIDYFQIDGDATLRFWIRPAELHE
jgi:hypothetical protein